MRSNAVLGPTVAIGDERKNDRGLEPSPPPEVQRKRARHETGGDRADGSPPGPHEPDPQHNYGWYEAQPAIASEEKMRFSRKPIRQAAYMGTNKNAAATTATAGSNASTNHPTLCREPFMVGPND